MPPNTISHDEYRRHIQRTKTQGNYFLFFRPYARTFGRDVAMMLCDLLNHAGMKQDEKGWFAISVEDLKDPEKSLLWDKHAQTRLIGKLVDLKIATVRYTGVPPKRQMYLDLLRIERMVDEAETASVKGAHPRTLEESGKRTLHTVNASYEAKEDKTGSRSSPDLCEGQMGFFPEYDKKPITAKWSAQCASQLRSTLVKHHPVHSWSPSKWAEQFRLLHDKDKFDLVLIIDAVEWFCAHYGEEGLPDVTNAKHFRKVFSWVVKCYDKAMRRNVEITDAARTVADVLKMNIWPKNSQTQILLAAQLTINGIQHFKRKLWAVTEKYKSGTNASFAEHLLNTIPHSTHFAQVWLSGVYDRIKSWDKWSGDLLREAFDGDHNKKEFDAYVAGLCTQYSGSRALWDNLRKELK